MKFHEILGLIFEGISALAVFSSGIFWISRKVALPKRIWPAIILGLIGIILILEIWITHVPVIKTVTKTVIVKEQTPCVSTSNPPSPEWTVEGPVWIAPGGVMRGPIIVHDCEGKIIAKLSKKSVIAP